MVWKQPRTPVPGPQVGDKRSYEEWHTAWHRHGHCPGVSLNYCVNNRGEDRPIHYHNDTNGLSTGYISCRSLYDQYLEDRAGREPQWY